ncbi:MAG: DUF3298 domain-containing protein [Bacteroidetes bacterium]|nr:MAG: DUF3298 domain-containing protein [Bacteroidota bacterium]
MNKTVAVFYGIVIGVTLLTSCHETKKISEPVVQEAVLPPLIDTTHSCRHYNQYGTDSAYFDIQYTCYRRPSESWQERVNEVQQQLYLDAYDFELEKDQDMKSFLNRFVDSLYQEAGKETQSGDSHALWYFKSQISVREQDSTWVELCYQEHSYLGGAHERNQIRHIYLSKVDGSQMKLEDFFRESEGFYQVLEQTFRKQQQIEAGKSLNEAGYSFPDDQFKPGDQFHFDQEFLYLHYGVLDIAPREWGAIDVKVSLKDLSEWMLYSPLKEE